MKSTRAVRIVSSCCAALSPSSRTGGPAGPQVRASGGFIARTRSIASPPDPPPPSTALCVSGETSCGWSAADTFECPMCERTVCYCHGAADETPALCDECAVRTWALWLPAAEGGALARVPVTPGLQHHPLPQYGRENAGSDRFSPVRR